MASIMVPKVSGLASVHYSQEHFKWHEIINEEKKIPSNCIMQNKKKFESMIYSRKNNLLSLSVTTISWGYNLTKFYLGSHYILSYISTYYLTQPIPSTPARRKKTWRSIYNSFFYFILTMIEIVVEECKKISQNNNK